MATAIFGRKKHMTQAFQDDGTLVGVTVIEVEPNFVTAVKTADEHGYDAVQVGFGTVPTRKVNRPHAGQFEKHEAPPRRHLKELRDASGSVGASADPARIFPGQKMPGQMGNKGVTVRNLEIVAVDTEKNELWVRGGVPGGKGSVIKIRKAGE